MKKPQMFPTRIYLDPEARAKDISIVDDIAERAMALGGTAINAADRNSASSRISGRAASKPRNLHAD